MCVNSLSASMIQKYKEVREAFTKKESKTLDICQTGEGGSGSSGWMSQPPYLVIRNVKTTNHFLKVLHLILVSEGQNNESKQIRRPDFFGGGVSRCLANVPSFALFCVLRLP